MPQRVIPATKSFIRRQAANLWQQLMRYGERHRLPVSVGNDVRLLPSGTDILGCLRTLIGRARRTIHFEIYEWANDSTGRDLMTSLLEAQARGVKVRGVVDHLGSWNAVRMIQASGLDVRFFHPIGWRLPWRQWRRRNHRKLLIADGTGAVVGSANWSDEYNDEIPPKYYRDLGIELQGPAIEQLEADFLKSWRSVGGTMPEPPFVPELTVTGPGWHCDVPIQIASSHCGGRWAIRHHFLLILRQLQNRAVFANAYFIPDPQFLRVLIRMASRGVVVDFIAPGDSDHPFAQASSRATFGRLLRAGVRIWERRGRVFHAKVALLDEDLVLVGTANLDSFSFKRNLELNLTVRSRALAKELQEALDEDRSHSRVLTLDEWLALPVYRRAIQNFAYLFWWWL
jgi:cardiolipin synthase